MEKQTMIVAGFTKELEKHAQWAGLLRLGGKILGGLLGKAGRAAAKTVVGGKAKTTAFGRTGLGTMLRGANTVRMKGGNKAALDYLARFKDPSYMMANKLRKGVPVLGKMPAMQARGGIGASRQTFARFPRSSIGNTAAVLQGLSRNMAGRGFFRGSTQMVRNVGNVARQQFRAARFREVELGTLPGQKAHRLLRKGSGSTGFKLKGGGVKIPFLGKEVGRGSRPVLALSGRGTGFVKRRPLMQAAGMAFLTPAGASLMLGLQSTDAKGKKLSPARRVGSVAADAALYGINPSIGIAATVGAAFMKN